MNRATQVKTFARQNWMLISLFCGSLGVTGWFAFQFAASSSFLNDPRHKDGDLKDWMNPYFISMMYDLPKSFVLEVLDLDDDERGRKHLGEIARERGITMEEMTRSIREEASKFRGDKD